MAPSSRRIRSSTRTSARYVLPEPLTDGVRQECVSLRDVPDSASLARWLLSKGLDTKDWGSGDTKTVEKFWKEIDGAEAGLELWRKQDGSMQPVRVTHVLRAKVTSPESLERQIFLFNTWQQYGDGRKRTRNGLLSEKLNTDEIPLEAHCHEVCSRAVVEEEMTRLTEAAFMIVPGSEPPPHDPNYKCPLTVVTENFVDHTIEVETSKSYPGLLTMYHLYTVDIVCTGLPNVDFNTLEYEHEDSQGHRKLKYVHAWVWLEWTQIQRYLFEGSKLVESRKKGSFKTCGQFTDWLSQFDIDLDQWNQGNTKSVEELYEEVEKEQTHLELWGRHDGVPLLMRVAHVIQLQVGSTDPRQTGQFLFQTWEQNKNGRTRPVNRLMAKKVSIKDLPFDADRFTAAAKEAIVDELTYLVDSHFQLRPDQLPSVDELEQSGVTMKTVKFVDHRFDLEESPSYKGIHTMYHLYTMEVLCDGLPLADFASIEFSTSGSSGASQLRCANGWRWVTWQQTLDILHQRTKILERREGSLRASGEIQSKALLDTNAPLSKLASDMQVLAAKSSGAANKKEAQRIAQELQQHVTKLKEASENKQGDDIPDDHALAKLLPPSMVSTMSQNHITSDKFLAGAKERRQTHTSLSLNLKDSPSPYESDAGDPSNPLSPEDQVSLLTDKVSSLTEDLKQERAMCAQLRSEPDLCGLPELDTGMVTSGSGGLFQTTMWGLCACGSATTTTDDDSSLRRRGT